MLFWIMVLAVTVLLIVAAIVYLSKRILRCSLLQEFAKRKSAIWMVGLFQVLLFGIGGYLGGIWNAVAVFFHLILFWLLMDFVFWGIEKGRGKKFQRYLAGPLAVLVTLVYLGTGMYHAYHVSRTAYQVALPVKESFRIVGFSDSHLGTTFNGEGLQTYVDEINAEEPDIVVIVGDFVDDGSTYEDLVEGAKALSSLKTKYGVYFVYGNHDNGYFPDRRGYGKQEVEEELKKNGVIILEDEAVLLSENITLIGRQDTQQRDRATMPSLMEKTSEEMVTVVLDHEPNDQSAQAQAGADLVLSGHTHGGQFFPFNRLGEWIHANDMTYGIRTVDATTFIVSSGIADWALDFKTGCISEYIVVDLVPES